MLPSNPPQHKYNMGLIGNCSYMAHINDQADVRWMCWPRFDDSFVFGGLLDAEKGGHFYIKPSSAQYESRQYYIKNTNILCTEFKSAEGHFRVIDCAPRYEQYGRYNMPLVMIRKIEFLSGQPKIEISCSPRANYGDLVPQSTLASNHIRYDMERSLRLYSDLPITYISSQQSFALNRTHYLVLTWDIPLEAEIRTQSEEYLQRTKLYWENWVLHSRIGNFYQKEVIRSSLALKLHQYQDTGAIIASGTTSLPEYPGSGRTWDYRFCWLRDSYYILKALYNVGHLEEMELFSEYIQNLAIHEEGRYQPVYSISGSPHLEESFLPLTGYLGNQPVRKGNQAHEHIQNDVYGQMLLSMLPLYVDERLTDRVTKPPSIDLIENILRTIERLMEEPDAGLWEFRNKVQHHCYTYLFHWAGSQAGIKIAKQFKNEKMLKFATNLAARAAQNIERCYDPIRNVYSQAFESQSLDACLLQLISLNYLNPNHPRTHQHLKALEKELRTADGLFYRYIHEDDFGSVESSFLICAYWYVEALACVGRVDDAIHTFENLMKYTNHLGLMSEDVDPVNGSQWGNFPQAYSHVGFMNAAFRITNKLDRPLFL